MVAATFFIGAAMAVVAQAQTIETSSASSVAPSTTVSQSMPPSATAGFNAGAINSTIACKHIQHPNTSDMVLTDFQSNGVLLSKTLALKSAVVLPRPTSATRYVSCSLQHDLTTNREQSTLMYQCVCPNGTTPDCSAYTNTIPFFECQETFIQCIAAHPNDAQGQATCTDNEKCGTYKSIKTKRSPQC